MRALSAEEIQEVSGGRASELSSELSDQEIAEMLSNLTRVTATDDWLFSAWDFSDHYDAASGVLTSLTN